MTLTPLWRGLAASASLLLAVTAAAAPVGFDSSFGSAGKVFANISFGSSDDLAQAVAVQPDGAVVVAGTCHTGASRDFCIVRFLANGDLDPSFGSAGKVVTPMGLGDDVARAITLDGTRIVVAGSCTQGGEVDFCVARYLANGALDASFNGTGIVHVPVGLLADQAYAVAMDGTRIVVAGDCEAGGATDSCLVRLFNNGTLDPAFGTGGKVILPLSTFLDGIRGLAVRAGMPIFAGHCYQFNESRFCVTRLNADGTPDPLFGSGGTVMTAVTGPIGVQRFDSANGLSLLADGRVAAGGQCIDATFNYRMCALVLNEDGSESNWFGGSGKIIVAIPTASASSASAVAAVNNNSLYLSGPCTVSGVQRFCVLALDALGLSASFNGGQPLVDTLGLSGDAAATAIAAVYNPFTLDTDISVVGSCGGAFAHDFCAARYRQTGARITSFGLLGVKVQELSQSRFSDLADGMVRQADGRFVVAGTCANDRACIARFNADGSLDAGFATGGILLGATGSSGTLPSRVGLDGTAILYATQVAGSLRVTRVLADGTPDISWGGGTGTAIPALPGDLAVDRIAGIASTGSAIFVGFTCTQGAATSDFCVAKLDAAGALDPAFNAGGATPGLRRESFGTSDVAHAMALDGGAIVMAGECRVVFNFDPCLMRFTASGDPDTTFNGTGKVRVPMGISGGLFMGISLSGGVITAAGGCLLSAALDAFCLARINANGTLDTTFNGTGLASVSFGAGSRIQGIVADGTGVVVAGYCNKASPAVGQDICLARFGPSGLLDADFNSGGTLRSQVGTGEGNHNLTAIVRDGARFVTSVQCRPPTGEFTYDFCLAAYLQLPASLPGRPTLTAAVAGDTQATVSFVPPASDGGSAITSYTATCGTMSATGAASPLTVTGLSNGVEVGCAVTATNAAGTGPASDPPVNVRPLKAAAVTLTASVNPSSSTGVVSFFAAVAGQGPTGTVEFRLAGGGLVPSCSLPLAVESGVATCSSNTFSTPGTYSITAHYSGDLANTAAVSAPLSHTVAATFEQLTVSKAGSGTATVTSSPAGLACGATCTAQFPTNQLVTLVAAPAVGTVVQSWSGCVAATGNECAILMAGPRSVQLTLALQQFPLTVAKAGAGSGTVSSSPAAIDCGATCTANLGAGAVVALTATPAAGSVFAGWSGACSGAGPCQLTMDAAKSATATFAVAPATFEQLTVSKAGNGTATVTSAPAGLTCGATCTAQFATGQQVILTAVPAAGTVVQSWSGCAGASGNECIVLMAGPRSVQLTLAMPQFPLAVVKAGAGSGSVSSSPAAIDCGPTCTAILGAGAVVSLTATPAAGSVFAGWSGACSGVGTCQLTMDAAKSATATFTPAIVPPPPDPPRLGNLSTRMQVLTGNDVLIGGFIIGGSADKTLVIRARGPSLASFGITNALADPTLRLVRSSDQATIAASDNWGSDANAAALNASGFAPDNALEAAILVTLPPGAYTAIVSGAGGGTGVGIVEVFEVDHPETPLINISTRGQVLTGNDVMIGGFVIQGDAPQTVIVRARGPSLIPFGIANVLANPALRLVRSSDQATLAVNDDWAAATNADAVTGSGFAPDNPLESAIVITLPPGAYTAIVSGVGGGTGVGIIEVFAR